MIAIQCRGVQRSILISTRNTSGLIPQPHQLRSHFTCLRCVRQDAHDPSSLLRRTTCSTAWTSKRLVSHPRRDTGALKETRCDTTKEIATPASSSKPKTASTTTTATTTSSSVKDDAGFSSNFSQGLTEYRWAVGPEAGPAVLRPSVLYRESAANRIRLFGMPKGFPDTTADGYRRFFYLSQANSSIADFSACIGYQSLLSGFFLGSSPQMWMLKDLIPALIAAYMANRLVSYESRPKLWFCVSVLLRNVTIVTDMVIPSAVPNHLVAAAILTAILKQSSALMFFVTRAAALQHYAINNNLAELTKKFNSFSMVTYTLATALAVVYCTFLTGFTAQLSTIAVCCVANVILSYMLMAPIAFRILNVPTMELLMLSYLEVQEAGLTRRILTPREISDRLGACMSATAAATTITDTATVALAHLLYVSPPIEKLQVRSDTLAEDVLYQSRERSFLLAMWRPSPVPLTWKESWQRWELPALPRFIQKLTRWRRRVDPRVAAMEKKFRKHRLCLLVQHKCTSKDLVTAYLIMYTAVLRHSDTEEELRAFIRKCRGEEKFWTKEGAELYESLNDVGWDVDRSALDHHDFRVSELPDFAAPHEAGFSSAEEKEM